jgi:glutamyl-tRNA synthetase
LAQKLENLDDWSRDAIESLIKAYMEANELKMGKLLPVFRAALVGSSQSPGIFDVLALLDKTEAFARLNDQITR